MNFDEVVDGESTIVRNRFHEICPVKKLVDMDIDDVEHDCHIAFQIIGFKPENFSEGFRKAWETSSATMLSDYIFDVWRECDGC